MKGRRGFTLVEILIVMAIVTIGLLIATTNLQLWLNHSSVVGFQREFLAQFNEARTRSMGSSRQYRLLIDMNAETVTLQRGNAGSASSSWSNAAPPVVGSRGAGVGDVVCTPAAALGTAFALVINPNGEVLVQTDPANAATIAPLTQANVHLSAGNVQDQSTIRVFGWTSKARLANGWL